MKFFKVLFWSILAGVSIYYVAETTIVLTGYYYKQTEEKEKALRQFKKDIRVFKKGIWLTKSRKEIMELEAVVKKGNDKKKQGSSGYSNYGTIYKSSKNKIRNIYDARNKQMEKELTQ